MPNQATDRNLLFGILALQMDFIGRDGLIAAMNSWVLEKSKPLGRILLEQKAFTSDTHALLEALVQKHLALHGNDAERSLAAVASFGSARKDLEAIDDLGLRAHLMEIPAFSLAGAGPAADDPNATLPPSVGISTSSGLRFRIVRPHAKGGLGEVFVAHDEELHREVALKEIQNRHADHPESRARFLLEAEITGGLEHPGIVPVYGLGQYADGRPFYAMRFIRGDSLQEAIKRYHHEPNRLEAERTVDFRKLLGRFIDVCQAIQYAHDRGVLHRDLKPGNIMLGKYGETLVVDWGLAKAQGRAELRERPGGVSDEPSLRPTSASGSAETAAGTAIGTPNYMSPEQAEGRLDALGPASDVYGLGATLYSLLTGKPPADGTLEDILTRVRSGDIAPPRRLDPSVDAALEAVCLRAMALRPGDRYASPRDLANEIEHWLAGEPVSAYREPWAIRARRWARQHKPLVSGAAAALLVALIALTIGVIWRARVQAETARKQTLTEEKIRQSLDQSRRARAELHNALKQPGGVQELLNQPARWQAQINSARADWQRASDLMTADGTGDPQWATQLKTLDEEIARDQADHELALRLEKIRLDKATLVEGNFDHAQAERAYPDAFARAGLAIAAGRQQQVAALIQQSAIKDQLLAALDDWAVVAHRGKDPGSAGLLLEVARRADPDPWRDTVRDPALWKNGLAMEKLAEEVRADRKFLAGLSPQMFFLIYHGLPAGKTQEIWLRTAQALHPADFWINFSLAAVLADKGKPADAVGFYRVALAIRPHNATVYNNLGFNLQRMKDLAAAVDAYHRVVAIDPRYATAWRNLGDALRAQKDLPAAIDAYRKALAIEPKYRGAWYGLAFALQDSNDLPAAQDAYQKAVASDAYLATAWHDLGNALRDPKRLPAVLDALGKAAFSNDAQQARTWFNLGNSFHNKNDLPGAIDAYKKAISIDRKFVAAWNNLGNALCDQDDFSAGLEAYHHALAIDPKYTIARNNLRNAERLLALEKRLPAVLAGDAASAVDLLALADLCWRYKKRHRDAADLYARAFAAEPKRAEDLASSHRYNAACAAAVAARGKGGDTDRLRRLALDWLNMDLTAHARMLETNPVRLHDRMQHWQRDADVAGLRDAKDLATLEASQRAACVELWAGVQRLAKQARASYVQTEHKGKLTGKDREQSYPLPVMAGKTYAIRMESRQFEAHLRLEDDKRNVVAENADIGSGNLNAHIDHTATRSDNFRIVATSPQQRGTGAYTITVREFTARKE